MSSLNSAGFGPVAIVTVDVLGPEAIQHSVGVKLSEPCKKLRHGDFALDPL